jgi:hypothetical protein
MGTLSRAHKKHECFPAAIFSFIPSNSASVFLPPTDRGIMSKRHVPVFLTQKEYDELLENVEVPADSAPPASGIKPVGRVDYNKRKYKERPETATSKSKELL